MAAMEEEKVELGFAEKSGNPLRLSSSFYPSKVGGKPSWLNLEDLPKHERFCCKICKKPMTFLIQVYAPFTDDPDWKEKCFHRTVFVFCCRDGKCYKGNSNECFLVLRSQLPRRNKFYSFNPPPELDDHENATWESVAKEFRPRLFACLCEMCGCLGEKKCSQCRSVFYCCREHQIIGWKSGHRNICPKLAEGQSIITTGTSGDGSQSTPKNNLFPEFEVCTEAEPQEDLSEERSEEDRMKEFEKISTKFDQLDIDSKSDKELEKLAMAGKEKLIADKEFKNFKKRVAREPRQILRFDRGGEPLWVSSEHQPQEGDIHKCSCGADRQFEFQIMPQLLNYLQMDSLEASIDWGTVAIFTCKQSCEGDDAYQTEFAWKQDFTDTGLPGNAMIG